MVKCTQCNNKRGWYEDVVGDGGPRMWIDCELCNISILLEANQIVNERSQEKDRQYGDFDKCMERMTAIFNGMTGRDLTVSEMYKTMVALKLAREGFRHKRDNLMDAAAYIGALDNYEERINNK